MIKTDEHYDILHKTFNNFDLKVPKSRKFTELLKMLYSPEEAELLIHFKKPYTHSEKAEITSEITGKPVDYIKEAFDKMVDKGTLFSTRDKKGEKLYSLPPFIPGFYEFYTISKNDKHERKKEILKILDEYFFETFVPENFHASEYPWFRVLPAESSLKKVINIDEKVSSTTKILTHEIASEYIKTAKTIAVADCACRLHAEMQDDKPRCDKPLDVCLVFDKVAEYWIEKGVGKSINHEEAAEVLKRSADAGLVHCTTNNTEFHPIMAGMICNCCPCCCFILQGLLKSKNQQGLDPSNFQPEILNDDCTLCMKCVKACPVDALYHHKPHNEDGSDNFIVLNKHECIGCGICATACKQEAIAMKKVTNKDIEPNVAHCGRRHNEERNH